MFNVKNKTKQNKMNIYRPKIIYILLIILLSIDYAINYIINYTNHTMNSMTIFAFCTLILNAIKSIFMLNEIKELNFHIKYSENTIEKNIINFPIFISNIMYGIFAICLSILNIVLSYSLCNDFLSNSISNIFTYKLHIMMYVVINIVKFYNVYEMCIYYNFIKNSEHLIN